MHYPGYTLAEVVRHARKSLGMTRLRLAKLSGLRQDAIAYAEGDIYSATSNEGATLLVALMLEGTRKGIHWWTTLAEVPAAYATNHQERQPIKRPFYIPRFRNRPNTPS